MTTETQLVVEATDTVKIPEGATALILTAGEGAAYHIAHNVRSLAETGNLDGEAGDIGTFILALAISELIENDPTAFQAAMVRVVGRLGSGTLKLVN